MQQEQQEHTGDSECTTDTHVTWTNQRLLAGQPVFNSTTWASCFIPASIFSATCSHLADALDFSLAVSLMNWNSWTQHCWLSQKQTQAHTHTHYTRSHVIAQTMSLHTKETVEHQAHSPPPSHRDPSGATNEPELQNDAQHATHSSISTSSLCNHHETMRCQCCVCVASPVSKVVISCVLSDSEHNLRLLRRCDACFMISLIMKRDVKASSGWAAHASLIVSNRLRQE